MKSPLIPLCQRGNFFYGLDRNVSPLWKKGVRGDFPNHALLHILSSTPGKFSKTSLSENRKTVRPTLSIYSSLKLSSCFASSSKCCPPSTSMTRCALGQ